LALDPIFKPAILVNVPNENMRVVENIYQVFIGKFSDQATSMFIIATLLVITTAVVLWIKPITARIVRK